MESETPRLSGSVSAPNACSAMGHQAGRIRIVILLLLAALGRTPAPALAVTRAELDALLDSSVREWRFRLGPVPGAEAPEFDDSDWERVDVGHKWQPHDSTCWYRARVIIPERISGVPVRGATVRMRVGIDNEARAHVDGVFRQQFTWADGDFVLREDARPGEVVTVALNGINRPGFGTLYQAYLTSDAAPAAVEGLRALLKDYDRTGSYVAQAHEQEAERWRGLLAASMARLDLAAYGAGDQARFLESVAAARAALCADLETVPDVTGRTRARLAELQSVLEQGARAGRQMAYQRLDARVIESFLDYVREDLGDGVPGHTLRGLWTAAFLDRLGGQAIEEARAILDDPVLDRSVPRYQTGPVAIRDGAFWQRGRPVFFTGVGHFDQVRRDIPILGQYGLNIIQIEMGPNSVVVGPDTVDERPIRERVLRVLDDAARHDVAVNLLISPHYFPAWALERFPDLAGCGHGFLRHCIDAPEARAVHERYLRALMPVIARHPALHSICLSNEPQYRGRCAYSRDAFRRWLERRYGDIERANAALGLSAAGFDDVPLPEDASNYALFHDFCRFNQDRFLEFHQFLAGLIHEYDPGLPVHAKVMAHAFRDPGAFEVGIDPEAFTRLDAIAGNDCVQTYDSPEQPGYAQRWIDMALNYTLQRSVAPASPVFNSENHLITDGDTRFIPASHIRTALWTQALHGQGATTVWVWERAQGGDFAENILTRAECVRALGRTALDLNRLGAEFHALQRVPSDLAILYVSSSLLPSPAYAEEAAAAFEGAYFADAVPEFVTERQVEAGALGRYRLVIVPHVTHIPEATVRGLQAFITGGGIVLAVGECCGRDEHGRPRAAEARPWQDGQGRLVQAPERLSPRAYRDLLDPLLDAAGCARPVRLAGAHGEPVWAVNLRAAESARGWLVSLVNLGKEPRHVTLRCDLGFVRALDLVSARQVEFPVALPPLEPVLLLLLDRAAAPHEKSR